MSWKKCCSSLVFLGMLLIPYRISLGCSWWYEYDTGFSLYRVDKLMPNNPYVDYNFSDDLVTDDYTADRDSLNLDDWQNYFGPNWNRHELLDLIYRSDSGSVKGILAAKEQNLPTSFLSESQRKLMAPAFTDFLKYLLYAKRCAPHAAYYDFWDGKEFDQPAISKLIEEGYSLLEQNTDPFIHRRIVYQIIRLNHYGGWYPACVQAFDSLMATDSVNPGLMYWWSMSLKAGAYRQQNNYPVASYYFSQVFASGTGRHVQAMRGFDLEDQEQWNRCYTLCQNDQERAQIWFMQGLEYQSRALPSVQAIWELHADEKKVLHLIGRDLRKTENSMLTIYRGIEESAFDYDQKYLGELLAFIENKVLPSRPKMRGKWLFTAGYLGFLMKQPRTASRYFQEALMLAEVSKETTEFQKEQLRVLLILSKYRKPPGTPPLPQEQVVRDLSALERRPDQVYIEQAYYFLLRELQAYYAYQKGGVYHALTASVDPYENFNMEYNPSAWQLDSLITFLKSPEHLPLDSYLVNRFKYSIADLYLLKARYLTGQNQLDSAQYYLHLAEDRNLNGVENRGLKANAFGYVINDCHDCEYERYRGPRLTLRAVVDSMIVLRNSLDSDQISAHEKALNARELANVYYNLTFSGNAWYMVTYDFGEYDYFLGGSIESEQDEVKYGELAIAYTYYTQGLYFARKMPDGLERDELMASLHYLIAKCEQNELYADYYYFKDYLNSDDENPEFWANYKAHRTGFENILRNYRHTQFYTRAIDECAFLQTYNSMYFE